jgi:uncharacterized membrane protein YqjE
MSVSQTQTQRSVPEVLHDIVGNLQIIVRAEFRLAKTELSEKVNAASKPAITLGAALLIGLYGCGFLLLSVVYALSRVMAAWAAALSVGGLLTIVGCVLAVSSRTKLKKLHATPDKTVRSLKEDAQWAKQQIK